MGEYKKQHSCWFRAISTGLVCLFLLNSIPFVDEARALARWAGTKDVSIRRDMARMAIEHKNPEAFISAKTKDDRHLLAVNHADIVIRRGTKGKGPEYILSKEAAHDDLTFLRAFVRAEVKAIMQIIAGKNKDKPDPRYVAIKDLILPEEQVLEAYSKLFPKTRRPDLSADLPLDDIIARAFELLILTNPQHKLVDENELPEEDKQFLRLIRPIINASRRYFTTEFWDWNIRETKIRVALANGQRFYQVADEKGELANQPLSQKRTYETRKVSSDGTIRWKIKRYSVGRHLAGKELVLKPFDGENRDSGFRAFYGKKKIAYYDKGKDTFKRTYERTYETRKVSSGGQIWWNKQYSVGTHLAGEELVLKPFDGKSRDSGFRAFYDKKQIAYYDKGKNTFKRTYETRKVSSSGTIRWKNKQYSVGTHLAGEELVLKPFDGKSRNSGFKAFYGKEQIAYYNAKKNQFTRERKRHAKSPQTLTEPANQPLSDHKEDESMRIVREVAANEKPEDSISIITTFPHEKDIIRIAEQEKAVVIERVTASHPVIQKLWELDHDCVLGFGGMVAGINMKLSQLKRIAQKNNISIDELRQRVGIPTWTETLIVTSILPYAADPKYAYSKLLLHEIMHLLEGDFSSHRLWRIGDSELKGALDIITDFLVFMFIPRSEISKFGHSLGYVSWSNEEKEALLKRYRDAPCINPNTSLKKIIQRLQTDIREGEYLELKGRKVKVSEVLTKLEEYRNELDTILTILLETEHFSRYPSLFPTDIEKSSTMYGKNTPVPGSPSTARDQKRTYETRKVSSRGRIRWKNKRYYAGTHLAGEELVLKPFDGESLDSGFKAFYGEEEIACYDKGKDTFERTYETRKVSSPGQIRWKNKRYYVGTHLAGEELVLKPFDGESLDSGFKAFYGEEQIAYYNAKKNQFTRERKKHANSPQILAELTNQPLEGKKQNRDYMKLTEAGKKLRLNKAALTTSGLYRIEVQIARLMQIADEFKIQNRTIGEVFEDEEISDEAKDRIHQIPVDEFIRSFYAEKSDQEIAEYAYKDDKELAYIQDFFEELDFLLPLQALEDLRTARAEQRPAHLNVLPNVLPVGVKKAIFEAHSSPEFGINICDSCKDKGAAIVHELMAFSDFPDDEFNEKVENAYKAWRKARQDEKVKLSAREIRSIEEIKEKIRKTMKEREKKEDEEAALEIFLDTTDISIPHDFRKEGLHDIKDGHGNVEPFGSVREIMAAIEPRAKFTTAVVEPGPFLRALPLGQAEGKAPINLLNRQGEIRTYIPKLVATYKNSGGGLKEKTIEYLIFIIERCNRIPLEDIFIQFQLQDIEIEGNLQEALRNAYLAEWSSSRDQARELVKSSPKRNTGHVKMETMLKEIAVFANRALYCDKEGMKELANLAYKKAHLLFRKYIKSYVEVNAETFKTLNRKQLHNMIKMLLITYDIESIKVQHVIREALVKIHSMSQERLKAIGIERGELDKKYADYCVNILEADGIEQEIKNLRSEQLKVAEETPPDLATHRSLVHKGDQLIKQIEQLNNENEELFNTFLEEFISLMYKKRDLAKLNDGTEYDPAAMLHEKLREGLYKEIKGWTEKYRKDLEDRLWQEITAPHSFALEKEVEHRLKVFDGISKRYAEAREQIRSTKISERYEHRLKNAHFVFTFDFARETLIDFLLKEIIGEDDKPSLLYELRDMDKLPDVKSHISARLTKRYAQIEKVAGLEIMLDAALRREASVIEDIFTFAANDYSRLHEALEEYEKVKSLELDFLVSRREFLMPRWIEYDFIPVDLVLHWLDQETINPDGEKQKDVDRTIPPGSEGPIATTIRNIYDKWKGQAITTITTEEAATKIMEEILPRLAYSDENVLNLGKAKEILQHGSRTVFMREAVEILTRDEGAKEQMGLREELKSFVHRVYATRMFLAFYEWGKKIRDVLERTKAMVQDEGEATAILNDWRELAGLKETRAIDEFTKLCNIGDELKVFAKKELDAPARGVDGVSQIYSDNIFIATLQIEQISEETGKETIDKDLKDFEETLCKIEKDITAHGYLILTGQVDDRNNYTDTMLITEEAMSLYATQGYTLDRVAKELAATLEFRNAALALKESAQEGFKRQAAEIDEKAAKYDEKSTQGLILYADPLLENAAILDLESAVKDILVKHNALEGGNIVIFGNDRENLAKSRANVAILERIIKHADSSLNTITKTWKDFEEDNRNVDTEEQEIKALIDVANRGRAQDILAVIKGPSEQTNELAKLKVPIVMVGCYGEGVYSFRYALEEARIRKRDNNDWIIMLERTEPFSDKIEKEYKEYLQRLRALQSA